MTKYFGVFGIEIKQGIFNACNFLFDFFCRFEKLAVTADFVAQFVRKLVPIGAVSFIKFTLDVSKIDDIAVTVRFVGAVDTGQGLQKIVGFDEPAQIEFFRRGASKPVKSMLYTNRMSVLPALKSLTH